MLLIISIIKRILQVMKQVTAY